MAESKPGADSRVQLSPEQAAVLETWGQGVAVMAGAGAGKTTTLVMKCEALLQRKPDARLVAVSFTERSASDLRARLSKCLPARAEGGPLAGHWVMTIHGLCGAILREFPREAGFDGEEAMLSEPESQLLWEQSLESLWSDELPESVRVAVDRILLRETRASLEQLLRRVRSLAGFGVLDRLRSSSAEAAAVSDPVALAQVGEFVLEKYVRLKRRRGAIDFDDLEAGADRALEHAAVREHFHKRFDLVLVDEFQDTNALQARILWRFARPDLSNLCVVGDPKQSIYRFRDADVTVFDECVSQLPVKLSLTWNFRSRPGIIDYANSICAGLFEASQMRFEPLVPKRVAILELHPVLRIDVQDPSALAKWIQLEVGRGVPLEKMALLVRRIRGNERWFRALHAAGIPLAVGSGGLFWEDPRVRELVALLRWWENPGNTLAGAVFMRAPWVGVPDAQLDQWLREDRGFGRPFLKTEHPIARSLGALDGRPASPSEVLQAALATEAIETELGAAWLGLWHRVEELSSRGLGFRAVVAELTLAVEESRREREVPPPKNKGTLPVLTLHGAKGLEFDHVILVDFGKKPRPGEMPLLFWDRAEGTYLGERDEDGDRVKDTPVEERWRGMERSKELAESKRVFYVALTRARERLVLVCEGLDEKQTRDFGDHEKSFSQDYWRSWLEVGPEVPTADLSGLGPVSARALERATGTVSPGLTPRAPSRAIRPRHSVTEWTLLSRCPRAYEWKFIRPRWVPEPTDDQRSFEIEARGSQIGGAASGALDARKLGTRVHELLEHEDWEGLRQLERQVSSERFRAEPVVEWAQGEGGFLRSEDEVWSELDFEVPFGGEILVGSIDRLTCSTANRYSVIDFKVTRERKSAQDLRETYGVQAELYAAAVHLLEPGLPSSAVSASLVGFSPKGVSQVSVEVPRERVLERGATLAREAALIVAGAEGSPRPGSVCRSCDFRSICPVGRAALAPKN